MMKSPAMRAALAPLHHLEAEAVRDNEVAREAYKANLNAFKLRQKVRAQLEAAALKKGKTANIDANLLGNEPEEPLPVRFRTNDTTYEAIGQLLISNPAGILIERDEVVSLLRHLDREEQVVARGFYMSGWDGKQPYIFDRIIRGHLHIEALCISILGNTQPARISEYVRRANLDGSGGDGLIQRFSLMTWPDVEPGWRNVDEYPTTASRERAWSVFVRMSELTETNLCVGTEGARKGPYVKTWSSGSAGTGYRRRSKGTWRSIGSWCRRWR
jgi:putative DNA primase/helicase